MYKRIDETESCIKGYSYIEHTSHNEIAVELPINGIVTLKDTGAGEEFNIYYIDIDNLIKALEAVKNHS